MEMPGDPNKNYMFFHHPNHPVPIPLYIRLSCDATVGSSAAAASGASTSSSIRGAIGKVNLKDQPDEFLMYIYKVKRSSKTRSHDWTECPYAQRGEKARRHDPTKFDTAASPAPSSSRGGNAPSARAASMPLGPGLRVRPQGQGSEYAHGVFEFWLHPSRYRTSVCENGDAYTRRICFFAHTPKQLRSEAFHD